ncbi:MAG: ubiquinone/menaquinone biosynthesis methyltransferase [Thermoleophilia bacterium]|nr:ubiquinone/menaquinone biosynthesis methyltransferase [Thermoleophilia bacterium]
MARLPKRPKLPDVRALPGAGVVGKGAGALGKAASRLPHPPTIPLPGPLARASAGARTRARRAGVKILTTGSGIPVVRPVAELGMRLMFDNLSGRWEAIREDPQYREGFRECLSYLPHGFRPRRVLDAACGTGQATSVLIERWPGVRVFGTDISPKMVQAATELVPEAAFQVASVHKLPFADGEFDLVTALDGVIDLAEMLRVLHRKGRLLIVYSREGTTPVSRDLDELATEAFAIGAFADAHTETRSHALVVRHRR